MTHKAGLPMETRPWPAKTQTVFTYVPADEKNNKMIVSKKGLSSPGSRTSLCE